MADFEDDDDLMAIARSLKAFRDKHRSEASEDGYARGYADGGKAMYDSFMSAAAVLQPVQMPAASSSAIKVDAAPKRRTVPKAPRGSVLRVVREAFAQFPLGFTVPEVMELVKLGGLPTVSDGSLRNHLRDMEKNDKAYRQGDRWFAGAPKRSPQAGDLVTDSELRQQIADHLKEARW